MCLHGVNAHGGRFRKLGQEGLAGLRVLALDLRGHGRSEWEPPWGLDQHLADVLETLDALAIERADWVGHSFGGRLVLELAAGAPERVGKAVLLDPALWVPPPIALDRAERERAERTYASPEEAIEQRVAESVLFSTPHELLDEDVREHLVAGEDGRWRYRYSQSSVVAAYGELARTPPPFESLPDPTLLVYGRQSDVVPEFAVQLLASALGDRLEVVAVPGGHNVLWDAFGETAAAVARFLVPHESPTDP